MKPPDHYPAKSIGEVILLSCALVATAYLITQNLKMDSFGHRMMFETIHGHTPSRLVTLREIDAAAHKAAELAGEGNLLVAPSSDPKAVSILHPRAVYALWPRRLYAVEPGIIVLDSAQIGPATRPSDPQWLRDHRVERIVEFGISENQLTVNRSDPISR